MVLYGFKNTTIASAIVLSTRKGSANRGLPPPLGRGVCETKSKNGHSRPESPLFLGISVLRVGNENSARSFSDRSFSETPRVMDVRAFGSWMSAPKCLFFQDFEGLTEVFAPGCPPGCPHGRPRDIRPQNLLFGLLFRS